MSTKEEARKAPPTPAKVHTPLVSEGHAGSSFPNANIMPSMTTWRALFWRRLGLLVSMTPVVMLSIVYIVMTFYTMYAVARFLLLAGQYQVPLSVKAYVSLLCLYYSTRAVFPCTGEWEWIHQLGRETYTDYPYFQYHTSVFEDSPEVEDPRTPLVPADAKTVFAFHPHGILPCGFLKNGVHSHRFATSNAEWLVTDNLFWFPITRDMLQWCSFGPVSKPNFVRLLKEERNICLLPGGFEEATIYAYGKHRVFIKERKGFIKLALQYGYTVRPVYTFGEELTYRSLHYFLQLRLVLNRYKIPGVLFLGSLWCFFMPKSNLNLITVVGKALELPHIPHPTRADVDKYHDQYVEALQSLFDRNKHKYAHDPKAELEFF